MPCGLCSSSAASAVSAIATPALTLTAATITLTAATIATTIATITLTAATIATTIATTALATTTIAPAAIATSLAAAIATSLAAAIAPAVGATFATLPVHRMPTRPFLPRRLRSAGAMPSRSVQCLRTWPDEFERVHRVPSWNFLRCGQCGGQVMFQGILLYRGEWDLQHLRSWHLPGSGGGFKLHTVPTTSYMPRGEPYPTSRDLRRWNCGSSNGQYRTRASLLRLRTGARVPRRRSTHDSLSARHKPISGEPITVRRLSRRDLPELHRRSHVRSVRAWPILPGGGSGGASV